MRNLGLMAPIMAGLLMTAPTVSPVRNVASRAILITAHDFAYTGLPSRVSAGWETIRMVNAGHELHMLATFSVPRGYTASTLLDSLIHDHVQQGSKNGAARTPSHPVTPRR